MDVIAPPNDKIAILKKIQKLLCLLSLLEGLFLLSQRIAPKTIFLLASSGVYWVSWRQLSYFGCILNQIFNLCIIWILLL